MNSSTDPLICCLIHGLPGCKYGMHVMYSIYSNTVWLYIVYVHIIMYIYTVYIYIYMHDAHTYIRMYIGRYKGTIDSIKI